MKSIKSLVIAFVLMFGISVSVNAQIGLTVGYHFATNGTWLINPQVYDDGSPQNASFSIGFYNGLGVAYKVTDVFSVATELNYNRIIQAYTGRIDYLNTIEENSYLSSTILKTLEIPILLRLGKTFYFEIGPSFQFVTFAEYNVNYGQFEEFSPSNPGIYNEIEIDDPDEIEKFSTRKEDVKDDFTAGTALAVGFGSDINLYEEKLFLNAGLRIQYTLTDMEGVNALGLTKDSKYVPENEKSRFETNILYGGIKLGLSYRF